MAIKTTGVRYDVIAKDSASKVFDKVGKQAGKLNGGFGTLAKSAAKFGAVMGGVVAGALAVSAEKAVEFQTQMLKIQTQAGASAKDVGVLSKQVLALGKSTQQGPQQLSEALYHLKSVGMDNVDAMKSLKVASDLAAVGGSDLEATTNALAGAWRTGIKGAQTFGESAKTVNAIIGAGNMTMADMVSALGTGILPTAKTFGLTFSQVGSALALFTDEGVDSASAATRLRMSISLLGAPSAAASKQLKKIGLTGTMLGDAMRGKDGIIGAISLLKDHLDKSGLSATQSAALLSHAFGGGKSSSAILSMVNNLDVLKKKQVQVNDSMGKFPAAVAAQRKTVQAQFNLIKSNLQVTEIELGDKLLPILSKTVVYLNKTAIPAIGRVATSFEHMIPLGKIAGDAKSLTKGVGDFISGLTGPKKATVTVTPEVKKLSKLPSSALEFGDVLPKPKKKAPVPFPISEGLIPTIPKAKAPKSQAQQLGDQLRTALSGGLGDAVKGLDWKGLGGTLGKGLDTAFGYVAGHSKTLGKNISKAIQGIDWVDVGKDFGATAIPLAIGFIDNIFQPLFTVKFWKDHWLDAIIAVISVVPIGKVGDAVGTVFSKIPWGDAVKGIGQTLDKIPWVRTLDWASWIGRTATAATKAAGDLVYRLGVEFTQSFSRTFPALGKWLGLQLSLIPTRLGVMGLEMKSALAKGFKTATDSVPGVSGKLVRAVLRFFGRYTFYQAGVNLIEGLYNGVTDKLAKVGGWVESHIIDPIVGSVKSLFGIHSPSTVFAGIGGDLISGLKNGILGGLLKVGSWLYKHLELPVLSGFSSTGSWLYGRGRSLISGLYGGVTSALGGVGKWVGSHIKSPVVGALVAPTKWLYNDGGNLVHGLLSGATSVMNNAKSGISHWAGQVKSKIVGSIKSVFGIHSPSKVMAELGGHMMTGLMKGLLQGKDVLNSTVKGIFHSPLDAAKSLIKNGIDVTGFVGKNAAKYGKDLAGLLGGGGEDNKGFGAKAAGSAQAFAKSILGNYNWGGNEFGPLKSLWNGESGWNYRAENASSGAYGIPQALPASKMASAGSDWKTNYKTQILWGLSYIRDRYGTPAEAWSKWQARSPHWYAKGGLAGFGETAWVGERGPELMQVTKQGTRIYNNADSLALAKGAGIKIPGYASGTVSSAQARVNSAQSAYEAAKEREDRARGKTALAAAKADLRAAQLRLAAAKKELSAATAAAKRSKSARTTVANAISNGFLKTLETGSASAIASAVKSMNTKIQNAGFGSMVAGNNKTAGKLGSLATQKASIASQISAANTYASDQASSLGDYLSVGDSSATTVSGLITQMQKSQSTAKTFAAEIAKLSKMGLNKTLLAQVSDQGPGGSLAALLNGASTFDIKNLNALATSQNKLTTSFGRTMADAMYDTGKDAGKGFLTGLKDQEKALQVEMNKLASGMVKTIKKKLGIHSPSTVMRDQVGKQLAYGVAAGVTIHTPKAVYAAQRMADMTAAVRARGSASGWSGGAAAPAHETHVHVHFDDPTLKGLIRVEVEEGHADLATALAAGGVQ